MANPRKRSPDRQSWKQGSKQQQQTPKAAKWFVTFLFLGLLTLFIWYWWPTASIRVQFLALEVSDYSKLVAPQLPSDTSVLQTDDDFLRFLDYRDESAGLDAGKSGLSNIANISSGKDRLVVYLSAHLVPIANGKVGILPRNYELSETNPTGIGQYELDDLLAKMQTSPAQLKLLLIDSGRLTIDPRLSLLGNQAYALLKSQIEALQDPSIGVIVSNNSLESATGWYGRPQTFFGEAVTDAFLGAADTNQDEWLTVGELYDHVAQECYAYSGENQSPVLLATSTSDFRDHRLFPFESRYKSADESSDENGNSADGDAASDGDANKSPDDPRMDSQPPSNNGATQTDSANVAPNDSIDEGDLSTADANPNTSPSKPAKGSGDPAASDPTAGDPAANDSNSSNGSQDAETSFPATNNTPGYLRTVDRAWRSHDEILETTALATKAPHLARELAARTLDYELRYHGHTPPNDNGLAGFVNSLEQIAAGDLANVQGELGGRIADALLAFSNSKDTEARAIRDVQEVSYRTRDYLDWHSKTVFLTNVENYSSLLRTLILRVNTFRNQLPSEKAVLSRATELQLNESVKNIKSAEKDVRDEWLRLMENAVNQQVRNPANQCLVEATLGTCLPSARQRTRWRSLLLAAREVELLSKPPFRESNKSTEVPTSLQSHLELQALFLAGDAPNDRAASVWAEVRTLATAIGELYATMPTKINTARAAEDSWRLAILDYRDAARVDAKSTAEFLTTYAPRAIFAWSNRPNSSEIGANGVPLPWSITNTTGQPAEVSVAYNPNEILLYAGQDTTADRILPNSPVTIPGTAKVNWFATPRDPKRQQSLQIPVRFSVRSGPNQLPDTTITFTQVVNDVGIKVFSLTSRDTEQKQTQSVVQLQPFPNRPNRFRFELTNPSSTQKTVTVRIAAVPSSPVTPGLLAFKNSSVMQRIRSRVIRNGKIAPGIPIVAESKGPIAIPPNSSEPLQLAPPAPPSSGDEEAPPPKAKFSPSDISYGLVCEITEQVADEDAIATRWIRWMEIRPAKPNTYLSCQADYTPKSGTNFGEFTATIRPIATSMPDVSQRPIKIAWDTSFLSIDPEGLRRGTIKSTADEVTLRGKVKPPARVWIDADGYPRAFAYKISPASGIEEGHTPIARIVSITNPAFPRSYAQKGIMREKLPELTEGQHNPRPRFVRGDLVPFPRLDSPIQLRFLVDAESKDFGVDDSDAQNRDLVRLEIGGQQEIDTFYDDRQVQTILSGIEDDTMEFQCAVSDFDIEFEDPGISAPERLELSMVIDGQKADADSVDLSIDQSKPEVSLSLIPSRVYPGTFFEAKVSASDSGSDIFKISVGYVNDKNDPLTRSKSTPPFRMKAPDELGRQWVRAEVLNGALVGGYASASLNVVQKPVVPEATPPPPPKYTVSGTAMVGVRAKGNIKLELNGKSFTTQSDGKFTFSNVPGGEHTITATAKLRGKNYGAERKINLPEEGPSRVETIKEVIKLNATK